MLAEGVVGEENLVVLVVGDHGVGPVHHGRLHEGEGALADVQRVAGLHPHEGQPVAVMGAKPAHALGLAGDDSGVGRDLG